MFAPHHGLDHVVAIVDHNGLQIDGACSEVMCLGEVAEKLDAFGWEVREADGHDVADLIDAITAPPAAEGVPVAVVAYTVKGKGVSFMEGDAGWHGKAPNAEQTAQALAELQAIMDSPAEGSAR
jgi:transketolase